MTHWQMENWGALRVAGISTAELFYLRLDRATVLLDQSIAAEKIANSLRSRLVDALYEAVSEIGDDPDLRRSLLKLKRDVFNQRSLTLKKHRVETFSGELGSLLSQLVEQEEKVAELSANYESGFYEEWSSVHSHLQRLMQHPRLLNGLLVSSIELAEIAEELANIPVDATLKKRQKNRLSTIGKYLLRAIMRTTPFSTFAGVALVSFRDNKYKPSKRSLVVSWVSEPYLYTAMLTQWLHAQINSHALKKLPLQATSLLLSTASSELTHSTLLSKSVDESAQPNAMWNSTYSNNIIQNIQELAVNGASGDEIVEKLSTTIEEKDLLRRIIALLVEDGYLQPIYPRPNTTSKKLRQLAVTLREMGVNDKPIEQAADYLELYRKASPKRRMAIISDLKRIFQWQHQTTPVYEDVILEEISAEQLGIDLTTLSDDLLPILHLARASVTNMPHYFMCQAFVERYGLNGQCDDVGGFISDLIRDGSFVSKLRHIGSPAGWLQSPLVTAIESGGKTVLQCDPAWFEDLPKGDHSVAVALFIQIEVDKCENLAHGGYQVVLNDVQCGRHKYLSRFLLSETKTAQRAVAEIRAGFASSDPLPVELSPMLGLNFQMHPQLCEWQLELPNEAAPGDKVLPLSDLRLSFDQFARELRLYSKCLRRTIELLHFGFLRDSNLPSSLLLLRALSPRYRDDLLSERLAIYRTLDFVALLNNEPIPFFRPRLEVGRLVLERARWAIPLERVPVKSLNESDSAFFRRIVTWYQENQLPQRGMAQRLVIRGVTPVMPSTQMYFDWHSPLTLNGLRSFIDTKDNARETAGWLLLRELLPTPETVLFEVSGQPHMTEWMVQFRWEP